LHYYLKVYIIQVNYVRLGKFSINKNYLNKTFSVSRGSPMVIGVKCDDQLAANHVPVMFSKGKYDCGFLIC
jgi:hypothetical protein